MTRRMRSEAAVEADADSDEDGDEDDDSRWGGADGGGGGGHGGGFWDGALLTQGRIQEMPSSPIKSTCTCRPKGREQA